MAEGFNDQSTIKSSVVATPKFGTLNLVDSKFQIWSYQTPGGATFSGKDTAKMQVDIGDKRIVYDIVLFVNQGIADPSRGEISKCKLTGRKELVEGLPGSLQGRFASADLSAFISTARTQECARPESAGNIGNASPSRVHVNQRIGRVRLCGGKIRT